MSELSRHDDITPILPLCFSKLLGFSDRYVYGHSTHSLSKNTEIHCPTMYIMYEDIHVTIYYELKCITILMCSVNI